MPVGTAAVDALIDVLQRGGEDQSGLDRQLVESVVEHERKALKARISVNNDISGDAPVTRVMIWSEIGPLVARLAVLYPTMVGPPLAPQGKDHLAAALKAIVSHTRMATRYTTYIDDVGQLTQLDYRTWLTDAMAGAVGDPIGVAPMAPAPAVAPEPTDDETEDGESVLGDPYGGGDGVVIDPVPEVIDDDELVTYVPEWLRHIVGFVDICLGSWLALGTALTMSTVIGAGTDRVAPRAAVLGLVLLTSWRRAVRISQNVARGIAFSFEVVATILMSTVEGVSIFACLVFCTMGTGCLLREFFPEAWGTATLGDDNSGVGGAGQPKKTTSKATLTAPLKTKLEVNDAAQDARYREAMRKARLSMTAKSTDLGAVLPGMPSGPWATPSDSAASMALWNTGGAGGPGAGTADPFVSGGWVGSIDPTACRVAQHTYWRIRQSATSLKEYLTFYYKKPKKGQSWDDLWVIAENADATLLLAYQTHGYYGVVYALDHDDRLEHALSRIGAEVALSVTGDYDMYRELQTGRAPGAQHVLPDWRVTAARDLTRSLYLQRGRLAGGGGARAGQGDDSDGEEDTRLSRRRNRGARPKPKAYAQAQATTTTSAAGDGATQAGARSKPKGS